MNILLSILFLTRVVVAREFPDQGIIGGQAAERDQFPFMATIKTYPTLMHRCGGVFIAPNLVLTAGRK